MSGLVRHSSQSVAAVEVDYYLKFKTSFISNISVACSIRLVCERRRKDLAREKYVEGKKKKGLPGDITSLGAISFALPTI